MSNFRIWEEIGEKQKGIAIIILIIGNFLKKGKTESDAIQINAINRLLLRKAIEKAIVGSGKKCVVYSAGSVCANASANSFFLRSRREH